MNYNLHAILYLIVQITQLLLIKSIYFVYHQLLLFSINLIEFFNHSNLRAAEKSKRNNKYILAVIIKILQNSPSKIWFHLDNHEYIKAAK